MNIPSSAGLNNGCTVHPSHKVIAFLLNGRKCVRFTILNSYRLPVYFQAVCINCYSIGLFSGLPRSIKCLISCASLFDFLNLLCKLRIGIPAKKFKSVGMCGCLKDNLVLNCVVNSLAGDIRIIDIGDFICFLCKLSDQLYIAFVFPYSARRKIRIIIRPFYKFIAVFGRRRNGIFAVKNNLNSLIV